MPSTLSVSLAAPFPLGDLVACVAMEGGGEARVVLYEGAFVGPLPARPVRLTLTTTAPSRDAIRSAAGPDRAWGSAPAALRASVSDLSEQGVAVPEDGRVVLDLLWLAPCDGGPLATEDKTRFGSYEHTTCARLVGKTADGKHELVLSGTKADFSDATSLTVGDKQLAFGDIIALAGDFYAHLDADAHRDFGWAWPPPPDGLTAWAMSDYRAVTLVDDAPASVEAIRKNVFREATPSGFFGAIAGMVEDAVGKYPTRRYLALASSNACHFACQAGGYGEAGNEALALYRAYHARALREAAAAGHERSRAAFQKALVVDAFGCHFLTDLFASGHIRVPRRVLGERFGIWRGALLMAKKMHDEDNRRGLWCTARARGAGKRVVWRAYGDGSLALAEAAHHRARVQEAVRVSTAEVFAAFAAAQAGGAPADVGRAEDLVPVPLAPGEAPGRDDILPTKDPAPRVDPNHYPLYKLDEDGLVHERVEAADRNDYLPLEVKVEAPALAPA